MGGGPLFIFVYFFGHFFSQAFLISHIISYRSYSSPLAIHFLFSFPLPFLVLVLFIAGLDCLLVYFLCGMWGEGYGDEGSMLKKYYT